MDLGGSKFTQPLDLASLQGLTALRRLGLSKTVVKSAKHGTLRLPALRELNVYRARDADGRPIAGMFSAQFSSLRELSIECEEACDDDFALLRSPQLSQLSQLMFRPAGTGDRYPDLANVLCSAMPQIRVLVMNGVSWLTPEHLDTLMQLPALRHIVLPHCCYFVDLEFRRRYPGRFIDLDSASAQARW